MKCYAQFYLAGCASPMPDDFEEFHSISEAKLALLRKHKDASRLADGPSDMWVYLGKPNLWTPYPCDGIEPDKVYQTGPRGGIQQL